MSDQQQPLLRIRVQLSARDPDALHFLLDAPVQAGAGAVSFDGPVESVPLARALFAIAGVRQVAVSGASINISKEAGAQWAEMTGSIAAAIRATLSGTDQPLGEAPEETGSEDDEWMLVAVNNLLASQINPSIAKHGGSISAERVSDGTLYIRMSGGCQGCAASQLTLRGGVERILRGALPTLKAIVDVTDHETGTRPFFRRRADAGVASPLDGASQARDEAAPLAVRVRHRLEALPPATPTISYGALARSLGHWLPGAVGKVTRALEVTMHEDKDAERPFIAARAISRATGLPGKGFFDLAHELARGPDAGESERAFHARELARLAGDGSAPGQ
ncbi:MAG TPA: hypothetical protein GX700_05950 [Paracoccus sp.]|nr:hypothetical protein [Paracoccus sp. (in: a-proteobacteria)]